MFPIIRTGLGRSLRRFLPETNTKPCVLGGLLIKNAPGFQADSDGDVICEALCQAMVSLTDASIDEILDQLKRREGITDSQVFLERTRDLIKNQTIHHVSLHLEGNTPKLSKDDLSTIRHNLSHLLGILPHHIGFCAISGDGLTDCSCGAGMHCVACITTVEQKIEIPDVTTTRNNTSVGP
jgi:2-C-methyl-D-erythritol 2,4-cyclodiphosphate synthase